MNRARRIGLILTIEFLGGSIEFSQMSISIFGG